MREKLTPAQDRALHNLLGGLTVGSIVSLRGHPGSGKTTVLRELRRREGGRYVPISEFVRAMRGEHPLSMEDVFTSILMDAIVDSELVIVDDLDLVECVVGGCSHFYPRRGYLNATLAMVAAYILEMGKRLVVGSSDRLPEPLARRAFGWRIEDFDATDYEALCTALLGKKLAGGLSFEKIFRFAPGLSAHQLKAACLWLRTMRRPSPDGSGQALRLDTDTFVDYLRSQRMASNVDLGEVQKVRLEDLVGVDDLIRDLEIHVIMPLEQDELAAQLDLKPKRGVLIAGPPGTGKTSVGRALAHRLKGKFFLIDGTFIAGSDEFYDQVAHVFKLARQNAPSVLFIDDSDVIFQSGRERGLYRYLLTMLDGLESETSGRVCVMLTAMNLSSLPPALIRSGRVELYLDTRLPDESARRQLLRRRIEELAEPLCHARVDLLVEATEGLTGADLRRVVEDGKLLFAYHRLQNRPAGSLAGEDDPQARPGDPEWLEDSDEEFPEEDSEEERTLAVSPPGFPGGNGAPPSSVEAGDDADPTECFMEAVRRVRAQNQRQAADAPLPAG